MSEVLDGLPEDVHRLLAAPPVTEKKLLELGLSWPDLSPGQAQLSDALRLLVITWDPLERQRSRPTMFATANGTPDGLEELVVYVPCWSLTELATARGGTATDVLSVIGSSDNPLTVGQLGCPPGLATYVQARMQVGRARRLPNVIELLAVLEEVGDVVG